jgi:hypothetical protein
MKYAFGLIALLLILYVYQALRLGADSKHRK